MPVPAAATACSGAGSRTWTGKRDWPGCVLGIAGFKNIASGTRWARDSYANALSLTGLTS